MNNHHLTIVDFLPSLAITGLGLVLALIAVRVYTHHDEDSDPGCLALILGIIGVGGEALRLKNALTDVLFLLGAAAIIWLFFHPLFGAG